MIGQLGGHLVPSQGQPTTAMFLKNIVSFQDVFGKETSGPEEYREDGEVGTGRWKVPTCKDYLYLFRSLLNCDTMKVKA